MISEMILKCGGCFLWVIVFRLEMISLVFFMNLCSFLLLKFRLMWL